MYSHCSVAYVCCVLAHGFYWPADCVSCCAVRFSFVLLREYSVILLCLPESSLKFEYCTVLLYAVPPWQNDA